MSWASVPSTPTCRKFDRLGLVRDAKKADQPESRGVSEYSAGHEPGSLPSGGTLQHCGILMGCEERPQTSEFPHWHDRGVSARAGRLTGDFPDPAVSTGLIRKHRIAGHWRVGTAHLPRHIKQHGGRATGVKKRDELRLKRSTLFCLRVLNSQREMGWVT